MIPKIDTHSHIGTDKIHPFVGDIEEYCRQVSEKNVRESYLFPVPVPRYAKDGGYYCPSFWEMNGTRLMLCSEYEKDGEKTHKPVPANPFAEYNEIIAQDLKRAEKLNLCHGVRLHFVPFIHPFKDTLNHVEMILDQNPPAIKMHGSSWCFDPRSISPEFFRLLSRYKTRLILHTDYHNSKVETELHRYRLANDPLVWLQICQQYGLRAILAHGARLCRDSHNIIRSSSGQFLVGISPKLNMNGYRVKSSEGEYFECLCEMASIDALTFDFDYPWNTTLDRRCLVWDYDEELSHFFSESELQRIYYDNAQEFFSEANKH